MYMPLKDIAKIKSHTKKNYLSVCVLMCSFPDTISVITCSELPGS